MSKLIRAGFFRYFHSEVFKACSALTLLLSLIMALRIRGGVEINEYCFVLETTVFAVMIALSLGNEASNHMKNKVLKGYSRTLLYFSEMTVAVSLVSLYFVWFAALCFVFNIEILSHIPVSLMLSCIFGFYLMAVMLTSAFVFIACAASGKAVAAIVCLVLVIGLYMTSTFADAFLAEPQYYKVGQQMQTGEFEYYPEENPTYVDEPLRSVLVFYRNTNPYGQRAKYEDIASPFLYSDEKWEAAKEAIADTLGSDVLDREISEDEIKFLRQTPLFALIPIPFFVLVGWLVFRKRSFR